MRLTNKHHFRVRKQFGTPNKTLDQSSEPELTESKTQEMAL